MGMHPLKQDDDEIQRLLTRVFHETGYRLDRRDPIIVPYIVQKIMLGDFKKEEESLYAQFGERTVSTIKAEIEKLEKQSGKLMELSRTTAADTVRLVGDEYSQHIFATIRKADAAVFESLNKQMARVQGAQEKFMKELDGVYQNFTDTANQFGKVSVRLFLMLIALSGIFGFFLGVWQRVFVVN
jgi:archaellum component FlaC